MSASSTSMDLESDNWSDSDGPPSPTSPPQLPDLPDYESDSDSGTTDTTLLVVTDVSDEEIRSLLDARNRLADLVQEQIRQENPEGEVPSDDDLEEGEIREDQMSNYIPDPKYTFLFDPSQPSSHHSHTCTICKTTPLSLLPSPPIPSASSLENDSVPVVLPCGHMFGQSCIRQWMKNHDNCPVCRTPTVHDLCKHPIRLRPIYKDNIWLIPRTVPDGGKISPFCRHCAARGRQDVINGLMETMGRLYYDARLRWRKTKRERDRVKMMEFRVRMDEDLRRLAVEETVAEWLLDCLFVG